MSGSTTQSTGTDDTSETIVNQIITTVADEIDADPMELEPLYETIDPEALDQLFHTSTESGQVNRIVFTYAGCEVAVYGNDEVEVSKLTENQTDVVIGETQRTTRSD